jgi:DNA-directed RNA polymerase subunit K/omega
MDSKTRARIRSTGSSTASTERYLIAAKRSKQLAAGATAGQHQIASNRPAIAIEEVEQGKIEFEVFERSEE